MASIGGITFLFVSGWPDLPAQELEELRRMNVWGVAFRQTGRRGRPFAVRAKVDIATATGVANSLAAQKALQGTLVSFTNDQGATYNGYIVRQVRKPEFYRGKPNPNAVKNASAGTLVGGLARHFLVMDYILQFPGGV